MNKLKIERFSHSGKEVLIIKSVHKINKEIINQLKSEFDSFNPNLILLEGNFDKAKFSSEKQAIKEGIDMGYLSFISKKKKIKVLSNDPLFKDTFDFLKRKHNKDFVLLYFFLRQKSFYLCNNIKFLDETILRNLKKNINIRNSKDSIIKIKKTFKNIFNKELKDKDYSAWFNPTQEINIFNQATRELNIFRDNFMINKLQSSIKKYNRIIIVKGEYHLKKYKEEIKKALRDLSNLEILQLTKELSQ